MQKYIISSRNEKKKERKPVFETFFLHNERRFIFFSYLWRKIKYHSLNHYYYG